MIDAAGGGRRQPDGVTVGPGDDAAVVAMPDGRVVVTTDMLVEGRHFRLDWSTPHDVGRKAIAQNAADVESMGASTTAFVVAFGAPQDTSVAQVQELGDGMWLEAGQFGAGIVGGDLVASPQWVISVTALGDLAGRAPVLRSGARPGSAVAVAGSLATLPLDIFCGTGELINTRISGAAIWCRNRRTARGLPPRRPPRRR